MSRSLDFYIKEIEKFPPIATKELERELIIKAKAGD